MKVWLLLHETIPIEESEMDSLLSERLLYGFPIYHDHRGRLWPVPEDARVMTTIGDDDAG